MLEEKQIKIKFDEFIKNLKYIIIIPEEAKLMLWSFYYAGFREGEKQ